MAPYEFVRNYEKNFYLETAAALNRYVRFRLNMEEIGTFSPNILLVEIHSIRIPINSSTATVFDKFREEIRERRYENVNGILFFTLEEYPRGDEPDSLYNKSRLMREFFENSFNAVTANQKDIFSKLSHLIQQIFKNKGRKLGDVIKNLESLEKLLPKSISDLANGYPYGGIHTQDGHKHFRELIEGFKNNDSRIIEDSGKEIYKMGMYYDLASIIACNPFQYGNEEKDGRKKGLKILVIDDNTEKTANDLENIKIFFPKGTSICITEKDEWKKFLHDNSFWENMYNRNAQLSMIKLKNDVNTDQKAIPIDLFEEVSKKFIFDFIVVDLLLGDYNEGNQIINNLENFRNAFNRNSKKKEERTYFDIIVLSLSEEAHDISRALNEGALCYVPKKRIYMLPAVVAKLEKSRQIIERRADQFKSIQKSRNFGKLYRLPEIIRRKLQTEPFLDLLFPENIKGERKEVVENLNPFLKEVAKEWIKNMPKADLHCHLGGSIDGDTAFFLSLNMLALYCNENEEKYEECVKNLSKIAEQYLEFISHLMWGNFVDLKHLFRIVKILLDIIQKFDIDKLYIGILRKQSLIRYLLEKKEAAYNEQWVVSYDILLKKQTKWFEVFFKKIQGYLKNSNIKKEAPGKIIAEKEFFQMLKYLNEENPKDIPLPDPVNIFNVLIAIIEGKEKDFKTFWQKLEEPISLYEFGGLKEFLLGKNTLESICERNEKLFSAMNKALESKIKSAGSIENIKGENLLGYFISAEQRHTQSLAEYLGGNEFMGSEQLQYKENILAALFSVIKKNVDDNVRYLEIRLSPDGYVKKGLTLQEAVQTLLIGTDLITFHFYNQGKFIRVNYIFSIKRHKAPQEAALEISAAIANREREKYYHEKKPEIKKENIDIQKYEWKPSKVVGIDLSGLEKGNPAQNFVSDFYPLFKTSSFITIHAGEEETAQSIWAAVYLLNTDRIGHGLTLQEIPELKDMFKNTQICIEMNPISNTLTNPNIKDHYPFYNYFIDGLNITINTDNAAVSESSLSDEFVKAGELFQKHRDNIHYEGKNIYHDWISKWEILRVVKNAFSSAFLDREEKRQLIRGVEEEIYQEIIKKYEC